MIRGSQTIFVTGGSGFVGRHVVRALLDHGYNVRALSRRGRPQADARIQVVTGDLTQPASFAAALEGADAVIHAGLTDGLSRDVEATSRLQQASAQAGVRRFLHLSTISVYGHPREGVITEDTPPRPCRDAYSLTKLAIEAALQGSPGCAEIAVLRLGCVYGPGGGWWTDGLLRMMARGKVILVDGGTGYANLIHVADVCSALLLLLARSNPRFEIYNLTDGEPIGWARYFSEIETLAGRRATVSMSAEQAHLHGAKWLHPSLTRRVFRKLTRGPLVHPLDDYAIAGFASRAVYSNARVCRLLGFRPKYDFNLGIQSIRAGCDPVPVSNPGGLHGRTQLSEPQ